MHILGIETSCDETSASVVEAFPLEEEFVRETAYGYPGRWVPHGLEVKSNVIASQIELHRKTGGVVPEVAAREHVLKIMPVIDEALKTAKVPFKKIDAVAVTQRPGLISSLLVGTNAANTISLLGRKTLIPVNHIEGHIFANWLDRRDYFEYPIVILTVSGGHNELVLLNKYCKFESLGSTRDDAAGEAFDKVARLLGLPYPGGPEISKLAEEGDPKGYDLPRALMKEGYDFSFSGLKSAVLRLVQAEGDDLRRADLAASFQEAVCDVLSAKLIRAANEHGAKEIHLAGGVSANTRLRELVEERLEGQALRFPEKIEYCTDNAAMIAAAGFHRYYTKPTDYSGWQNVEASTKFGF
jgi:N6-L-threonylcarbamoyladenine synthase